MCISHVLIGTEDHQLENLPEPFHKSIRKKKLSVWLHQAAGNIVKPRESLLIAYLQNNYVLKVLKIVKYGWILNKLT